jgi:peroxiredoxin
MKWRSLEEAKSEIDLRPLREILAERQAAIAKYVPAETQAVHARAIAELKAKNLAAQILPVGASIPDFELQDQDSHPVSSTTPLTNRLVLIFFRGRWCPFCVAQLEAMNLIVPALAAAGAALAAISPQTVKQSYFMRDQHHLRFPLLSDPGNRVARQFGLTYRVPDEQKSVYQRSFVNLPLVNGGGNGDENWELPIPATYVVERDGVVLYASSSEDYRVRPEPQEMLDFLTKNSA